MKQIIIKDEEAGLRAIADADGIRVESISPSKESRIFGNPLIADRLARKAELAYEELIKQNP